MLGLLCAQLRLHNLSPSAARWVGVEKVPKIGVSQPTLRVRASGWWANMVCVAMGLAGKKQHQNEEHWMTNGTNGTTSKCSKYVPTPIGSTMQSKPLLSTLEISLPAAGAPSGSTPPVPPFSAALHPPQTPSSTLPQRPLVTQHFPRDGMQSRVADQQCGKKSTIAAKDT